MTSGGPCTCFFQEVHPERGTPESRTSSSGNLSQLVYRVGSRDVVILGEDTLTAGDLLRDENNEPKDRTGMLLWPGSTALAHLLLQLGDQGALTGCSVLELGSGLGFCGVIAGFFAAEVVLTDQSSEVLAVAKDNLLISTTLCARLLGAHRELAPR